MWKVKGRLITKRTEPLVTHNLIIHDELRAQGSLYEKVLILSQVSMRFISG